jgi:hypothetical protein
LQSTVITARFSFTVMDYFRAILRRERKKRPSQSKTEEKDELKDLSRAVYVGYACAIYSVPFLSSDIKVLHGLLALIRVT